MAHFYLALSFVVAFTFTNAKPFTLFSRGGGDNTVVDSRSNGDVFTDYAPNWPTCGNDHTLTDTGISTTITVNVRPDCDTVIDTICKAAVIEYKSGSYMSSIGHTTGTCEGHIMFSQATLADPLDYATCAKSFQSITETCMLTGDSTVKNYAAVGSQFGVQNIHHNPASYGNQPTFPIWSASSRWNLVPGYMMGPPGVWGSVYGKDATDILPAGS